MFRDACKRSGVFTTALALAVAGDRAAPAQEAALPKPYRRVLHVGDSMVGGYGGLAKALEARFRPAGVKFVREAWVSAHVARVASDPRLPDLLRKYDPDLVLITLGANDVFIPHPDTLAGYVESIAKKVAPRDCYWIGPPTWKKDTGIVDVIRKHSGPCQFFDSSDLALERAGDGIHPTDRGGARWAERFWAFFSGASRP